MKKTLILLAFVGILCSCEPSEVRQGRKIYEAYFNYILKDPNSLVIYNEHYTIEEEVSVVWEIDYGAKNSYGGMVRDKIKFTTVANTIFIDQLYGGGYYDMKTLTGR